MSGRLKKHLTRHFLFLGKSGPTFNCYKIRFRVRRKTPNFSDLCRSSSECLRPLDVDEPASCSCLTGRGILFALHLIILVVGGADLCLQTSSFNSTIHLSLSTIAAVLTTIQLALRIIFIQTYRVKTAASDLCLSADGNDVLEDLMRVRSTFRRTLTVFGMSAILINVVLYPLFYVFVHLGWSHITNNVLIMCFGRAHDVFQSVLDREVARSDSDSHKAVLFEAAQLLEEQLSLRSQEARLACEDRESRFLTAFRYTPCYVKPDYINFEEARPRSVSNKSPTDDESGTLAEHLSCI